MVLVSEGVGDVCLGSKVVVIATSGSAGDSKRPMGGGSVGRMRGTTVPIMEVLGR